MNDRTKTGLEILTAAAIIGIFGNILLRQTPWGLNAFLFVTAFAAALLVLTRKRRPELLTVNRFSLIAAMVFFASMFVIRDSIELRVYDTFAILIIMGVLTLGTFGVNARVAGVFHYVCGFLWSGLVSVFAPLVVLGSDIDWKAMPGTRLSRQAFSVLRGAAIAIPLVLIFGALFSSADARFENLANRFINFDLDNVLSHVVITLGLAWLSAGYFRGSIVTPGFAAAKDTPAAETISDTERAERAKTPTSSYFEQAAAEPTTSGVSLPDGATILEHINRSDPPDSEGESVKSTSKKRDWQNIDNSSFPAVFTFGATEVVIILGLVDLLFLSFVIIQVPYLFGGMDLVQNTPDFKLADYARRGFGELVAVSALVLPVLLLGHWLIRKESPTATKLFRVLAGVQIILLFVIMASAVQRLVLLTGNLGYGLTTVRLYPMIFMIWLGIVFVWFGFTVLRGARQHFAWGALWAAFLVLGATHVLNPDEFIVKTNIALMQQGREFDARYNAGLSADATPTLLESFANLSDEDQVIAVRRLAHQRCQNENAGDLRSWNLSRWRASRALQIDPESMNKIGGCGTPAEELKDEGF